MKFSAVKNGFHVLSSRYKSLEIASTSVIASEPNVAPNTDVRIFEANRLSLKMIQLGEATIKTSDTYKLLESRINGSHSIEGWSKSFSVGRHLHEVLLKVSTKFPLSIWCHGSVPLILF